MNPVDVVQGSQSYGTAGAHSTLHTQCIELMRKYSECDSCGASLILLLAFVAVLAVGGITKIIIVICTYRSALMESDVDIKCYTRPFCGREINFSNFTRGAIPLKCNA